ncbi:MAG: hypothetical protein GF383_05100, partial [Candidatus Lokiarchaeota archaeon]|nr:hypothetical protein [Candidatus Lokiarchaeota archaeon]MBD3339270.1 hypothetical protein [Candidatus Lokiarchaeota archaeon]
MTRITELNWGFVEILQLISIFITVLLITLIIMPRLITYLKNKGIYGFDIHKNNRPKVAESGGIGLLIGVSVGSVLMLIFFPMYLNEILVFLFTVLVAGLIGLIDDRIKLRSRYKILLTLFTGLILLFANFFNLISIKSPTLPFLGFTRLTIIYPLLIPLIVAVFANTCNMLEGYNGEGSGTILIAAGFLFFCALLWNSMMGFLFLIVIIAVLIPFYKYNRYPSKVFPGDVGTLSMGAMLACVAILGSLEVPVFCAILVHIFNSFYVISSVRGFFESSEIMEEKDDIILLENDKIKASYERNAAMTLPRLILAKGPLSEPELVRNFYAISIICGFFSLIATLFMVWTMGNLNINIIIVTLIIMAIPTVLILYKFPRIRGIVSIMIFFLVFSSLFIILIDVYVMDLDFAPINLILISIPINILFSFMLY